MRYLLAVGLVLACTGCVTAEKVAKTSPSDVFLVHTSVDAFTRCAIPKLSPKWPSTHVVPISGGQRIIANGPAWGPVPAVADVYESSDGTVVEVRWGPGKSNGITDILLSCG